MDSVVFFEATGVRQLSDGNVVVLDGGDNSLKFFDANGALAYRTGRRGSGPGEFADPVLVPDPATDSLLVWDIRLVRLSIYSDRGRSHRLLRPRSWAGGRPPLGFAKSKALVDHSPAPISLADWQPGVWESPWVNSWIDIATGQRATVDTIVRRYYRTTRADGVRLLREIPFTPAASAVVHGMEAWLTGGEAARIQVHNLDGTLIRSIRVNGIRRPVTDADLNGLIDARTVNSNASRDYWERTYAELPIPDSLPTFVSMVVDVRGHVWAEVYEWDSAVPTEWIVFESSGRALGSVSTPRGLQIHQIGTNFILGVRKDSDGIDWVERYVLVRDTS